MSESPAHGQVPSPRSPTHDMSLRTAVATTEVVFPPSTVAGRALTAALSTLNSTISAAMRNRYPNGPTLPNQCEVRCEV